MTANVIEFRIKLPVWTFADRLRKVRRESGLGQVEFADALGVGRQTYAAWETGRNTPRDLANAAEQLEAVTGVPRAWFLGWMDNAPEPSDGPEGGGSGRRDSNSQHSAWNADTTVIELFPSQQELEAA